MSTARSTPVSPDRRFHGKHACPICRGADDDPRGNGSRCFGFLSEDERYAYCTREDHAGRSPLHPMTNAYPHLLKGKCQCGVEHEPADPGARRPDLSIGGAATRPTTATVARYDYHHVEGAPLGFQVVRTRDSEGKKGFYQRRKGTDGTWITRGVFDGFDPFLYRRPELLAAPPEELVAIPEGEKDVENLRTLGFVATCNPMGQGKWRDAYAEDLVGRHVAILEDNDQVGRDHAQAIARSLRGKAASVKVVTLPGLPEKGDVTDWIAAGGTAEDLRRIIAEAPTWAPDRDDERPVIECSNVSLDVATSQTIEAIERANRPPVVFQTGGVLSRIKMSDADNPRPIIDPMSQDALRNRMADVATFKQTVATKKGETSSDIFPPRDIVRSVMAMPGWSDRVAPPLDSIHRTPRFHRDGRLIIEPGYHREARLYYDPRPGLEDLDVPPVPTPLDVEEAKALVFDEYLVDFSFADQASKANAAACMLLPFIRAMIDGPTPMHEFGAPTEGTGKGKLANACAFPSLGHDLISTPQKEDEAETRKALTTAFAAGSGHLYYDNMDNPRSWDGTPAPISSGVLASALTQPIWEDRILGVSRNVSIPIRCVFMCSGNNLEWSRELRRRIVLIMLRALIENPSERTGFKHDPLEEWAQRNHRALVRACLILCQNWIANGRPKGKQVMGSYEDYARVMGGILGAAGIPGFLENRPKGPGKDRESVRWSALVTAWHKARGRGFPTSASQLHELIFGIGTPATGGDPELQIAFADISEGSVLSQKQKIGNALRKQDGRVWGDHRIVRCPAKGSGGMLLYKLTDPEEDSDPDPD